MTRRRRARRRLDTVRSPPERPYLALTTAGFATFGATLAAVGTRLGRTQLEELRAWLADRLDLRERGTAAMPEHDRRS